MEYQKYWISINLRNISGYVSNWQLICWYMFKIWHTWFRRINTVWSNDINTKIVCHHGTVLYTIPLAYSVNARSHTKCTISLGTLCHTCWLIWETYQRRGRCHCRGSCCCCRHCCCGCWQGSCGCGSWGHGDYGCGLGSDRCNISKRKRGSIVLKVEKLVPMKQFEYDDVHLLHREFARPVIYTNISHSSKQTVCNLCRF